MAKKRYSHCVDCGVEQTTYSQQVSSLCRACSRKRRARQRYPQCVTCGTEQTTRSQQYSKRCSECSIKRQKESAQEGYSHCIDCGEAKTTYSQRISSRCIACSGKHKRANDRIYYTHCVNCGIPKSKTSHYPRCRKCSAIAKTKSPYFDTCQECGTLKSRNKSQSCMSCSHKKRWESPEYRERLSTKFREVWADPKRRESQRRRGIAQWQDQEVRKHNIDGIRAAWENNDARRNAVSKWVTRMWDESGRRVQHYDHCQGCGREKTDNDRELCMSCAGVKRMEREFPDSVRRYPLEFNETLREMIRERQGRKCALCHELEDGYHLDVHHIDYDKDNNDPVNLMAMCRSCHSRTNWQRPFWQGALSMRWRIPKQD